MEGIWAMCGNGGREHRDTCDWEGVTSFSSWDGKDCRFYISLSFMEKWQREKYSYIKSQRILTSPDSSFEFNRTPEDVQRAGNLCIYPDLYE